MESRIHPSAIVESGAQIDSDVKIGPYCVVGPDVVLEKGVVLHAHVNVQGRTRIAEGTQIYPFASVGSPPQDLKYKGEPSELVVGKNCVIREYVTLNTGTESGGMRTEVGDGCLLMVGSHVAHDCKIGHGVIMANNATLGGHVQVGDHAVIGGLAAIHQFVRIGAYAIVGGMSGVENDVIPYGRVKGERAFLAGLNLVGLERAGMSRAEIRVLQKAFNQMFADDGTLDSRVESVSEDFPDNPMVMALVRFAREKTRFPLCQPARKSA